MAPAGDMLGCSLNQAEQILTLASKEVSQKAKKVSMITLKNSFQITMEKLHSMVQLPSHVWNNKEIRKRKLRTCWRCRRDGTALQWSRYYNQADWWKNRSGQ